VITAVVGILLLSEAATAELAIASALILGGIGITILGRQKKRSD
jgi:drug/metabolite transporter (DMT)-like permease